MIYDLSGLVLHIVGFALLFLAFDSWRSGRSGEGIVAFLCWFGLQEIFGPKIPYPPLPFFTLT